MKSMLLSSLIATGAYYAKPKIEYQKKTIKHAIEIEHNEKLDQWGWQCVCGAAGFGYITKQAARYFGAIHLGENTLQ